MRCPVGITIPGECVAVLAGVDGRSVEEIDLCADAGCEGQPNKNVEQTQEDFQAEDAWHGRPKVDAQKLRATLRLSRRPVR